MSGIIASFSPVLAFAGMAFILGIIYGHDR